MNEYSNKSQTNARLQLWCEHMYLLVIHTCEHKLIRHLRRLEICTPKSSVLNERRDLIWLNESISNERIFFSFPFPFLSLWLSFVVPWRCSFHYKYVSKHLIQMRSELSLNHIYLFLRIHRQTSNQPASHRRYDLRDFYPEIDSKYLRIVCYN